MAIASVGRQSQADTEEERLAIMDQQVEKLQKLVDQLQLDGSSPTPSSTSPTPDNGNEQTDDGYGTEGEDINNTDQEEDQPTIPVTTIRSSTVTESQEVGPG